MKKIQGNECVENVREMATLGLFYVDLIQSNDVDDLLACPEDISVDNFDAEFGALEKQFKTSDELARVEVPKSGIY